MNEDYESRLEAAVHRELAGLPELRAPSTVAPRVMAALAARARLPWYRQSWQCWPLALRAGSLVFLTVCFVGICFAGMQIGQSGTVMRAFHNLGSWLSTVTALGHALNVVLGSVLFALKQISPVFLIGCALAAALGYAFCVGLGTVYFRIAFARR